MTYAIDQHIVDHSILGVSSGATAGTGTTNALAKWTAAAVLGNSNIIDGFDGIIITSLPSAAIGGSILRVLDGNSGFRPGGIELIGGNGLTTDEFGCNIYLRGGLGNGTGKPGAVLIIDPVSSVAAKLTTSTLTGANKSFDFPNQSGTFALTTVAQTFTGTQTVIVDVTQDAVALQGRSGGVSGFIGTLTPTTLTASRTYTLPDATGTFAMTSDLPVVSDVAYDATTWNANLDAPSKNAVRDKFETLGTLSTQNGTFSGTSSGTNTGDVANTVTNSVSGTTNALAKFSGAHVITNSLSPTMVRTSR